MISNQMIDKCVKFSKKTSLNHNLSKNNNKKSMIIRMTLIMIVKKTDSLTNSCWTRNTMTRQMSVNECPLPIGLASNQRQPKLLYSDSVQQILA